MSVKPNVVFVLGPPGAGKGTQCAKIVEKFGYVHLSAGDLLRAEMADPNSSEGKSIAEHIKNGTIVPVAVTCGLLKKAMKNYQTTENKNDFLIDGFPRNKDNLDGWNLAMSEVVNLRFVMFFECDPEQGSQRCLERGKSSGRSDDNIESLKKRITTYNNDTVPILEHYGKENKLKRIDASPSPEEVFEKVKTLF